jgi:hypothetical protein
MTLRSWFATFLILAFGLAAAAQRPASGSDAHSAAYRSTQQKLAYLKLNASRPHPDLKPVELTEAEVNAYFNEGGVKLPNGVSGVRLTSRPGVIDGRAHVDFEPIMQGRNPNNPLYSLFSGQHQIHVVADGEGTNGVATIKVQTVEMDDVAIPQWALEFFLQHYITPKYHNVGMTSTFPIPLRVQTATVEAGKVRLEQR